MINEPQTHIYEFDDFRVDAMKRLLLKGNGEPVPLTPKVFDTLLHLVRHAGKIVEKDELMREIWTDTIVEENNLSQNISILRRVLGEKRGEHRFIVTIPGRGFRFVAVVSPTPKEPKKTLIKSIAVLPFKPLVAENRDEILEIGMADTLISQLDGKREVVVRPLTSVRRFGGLEQDAAQAGRALNVESVLDGNIQRWGDNIRVNVRLIRVADDGLLWTGTFYEKFTDIFVVQNAISKKVAAALSPQLSGDGQKLLNKGSTENVEAYQLYLKGRFFAAKLTPAETQTGISYFQQAIDIDPSYALAYVGLANAYFTLPLTSDLPPKEFAPKARAAVQKAIENNDTLDEAYVPRGWISFWYDWDWKAAENYDRRALELNPNLAAAHESYAHLLSNTGRHAEALAEIRRARELDPLNLRINALEGQFLIHAGRADEALTRLQKTYELMPNFWMARLFASSAYIEKGMYQEAVDEAEKAREFSGASTHPLAFKGYALAKSGNPAEARAVLEELSEIQRKRYVPPYYFALIYQGLGEREQAFDWLERGFQERDPKMTFLKVEPKWNNLRGDARFVNLMKRMNFEE